MTVAHDLAHTSRAFQSGAEWGHAAFYLLLVVVLVLVLRRRRRQRRKSTRVERSDDHQ